MFPDGDRVPRIRSYRERGNKMKTRNSYHEIQIILTIAVALTTLCICAIVNAAAPEWSIIQITDNSYADGEPQISGANVVWLGHDGNDYEIFFYDASTFVFSLASSFYPPKDLNNNPIPTTTPTAITRTHISNSV